MSKQKNTKERNCGKVSSVVYWSSIGESQVWRHHLAAREYSEGIERKLLDLMGDIKMENKIRFTQVATQGLPKGFPVVLCKPSSVHLQARAMVGNHIESMSYAHPMGILEEDIEDNTIMFKSGELGYMHPNHPMLVGPYALDQNNSIVVYDSTKFDVRVNFNREYPLAVAILCVDPKYRDSNDRNKETGIINIMIEFPKWLAEEVHENARTMVHDICKDMFPEATLYVTTRESSW